VIERSVYSGVEIDYKKLFFRTGRPGRKTTDAIFVVRQVQEQVK